MYTSNGGGGRRGGGGRLTVISIGTCGTETIPVVARSNAAARLQGLLVRIQPRAWTSVSCECCQTEVSTTGRLLVLRSPNECGVSAISKH